MRFRSPGSCGGGGKWEGDGGRDGTVMAGFVPAAVASLVVTSMLFPVSLLESTKLLTVSGFCSVTAPAE